jgi:hypothetical protein
MLTSLLVILAEAGFEGIVQRCSTLATLQNNPPGFNDE